MRWLPNRERPQHWALRIFQIAQATALVGMPLVIAIGDQSVISQVGWWFSWGLALVAWAIFSARCGWAVTLMIAGLVIGALIPVINGHGDAEAIMLRRLIAFGVVGSVVGGFLDAIGLATRAAVDYSSTASRLEKPTICSDEPIEPPPPTAGDLP